MPAATPDSNMELLHQGYAALQNGDLDAASALLTEDFVANLPGLPHPLHGRAIWRAGAQAMLDAFPDLRIDVEDMFAAADKVAVRVRFQGTHQGTFEGRPPAGRSVDFRSLEIYRLADGKIAEEWVAPDMAALMQQISDSAGRA